MAPWYTNSTLIYELHTSNGPVKSTMAASFAQSPLFARGTPSTAVQLASGIMSQQEPDGEQHNWWSTVQYYGTVQLVRVNREPVHNPRWTNSRTKPQTVQPIRLFDSWTLFNNKHKWLRRVVESAEIMRLIPTG